MPEVEELSEAVLRFGYIGLFVVSFLSATLLPLFSEVFVLGMPALGYNVWWIIVFATAGSFLGSLTNYFVGKRGADFVLARYVKIGEATLARAELVFNRWGSVALFFSWVPFIGDPLTAVAGAMHCDVRIFSFWVLTGKLVRYLVLLGLFSRFTEVL